MSQVVLTVNAGSSSVKFGLFAETRAIVRGEVGDLGHLPHLSAHAADGGPSVERTLPHARTHEDALAEILAWIDEALPQTRVSLVGHRVVHGGERFVEPTRVTPAIRTALERLIPLAPLHQPHNLAAMDALARLHPDLPQIACFDTAFHVGQPWEATAFALPRELLERGIRRYGFHGLSYAYIASVLPEHLGERADGRVVVAHLGSGASMCAMRARRSIATTMGFTALDGLPMGTRSGSLDPGVLLYLAQEGWSEECLAETLWHRSGLLGLSGISDDMRTLLASPDPRAAQAVSFFCHRAAHELGSLTVALSGLDALIFTGGIGEHATKVRARICELARCLGIVLNPEANEQNVARISAPGSTVIVHVIPTDEESVVAQQAISAMTTQ